MKESFWARVGFIVTNMSRTPENVVHFYNKRGTCEQDIREGKLAITWTRLSCSRFSLQPGDAWPCSCWRTTWATSCAASPSQTRFHTGHSQASS